jgi:hypothetical protein
MKYEWIKASGTNPSSSTTMVMAIYSYLCLSTVMETEGGRKALLIFLPWY